MSEPASISTGIAARYAAALFELAQDAGALDLLEQDTAALGAALGESHEFVSMIASPVLARDVQGRAIGAIAEKMGLSDLFSNTLALMASKRRLFVVPQLIADLQARIAEHKGEVTAEVTSAAALSDAQASELSQTLTDRIGKTVKLKTAVDATLIGGLVVKVGSKMIDTSIRAKLASLQNAMKEVG